MTEADQELEHVTTDQTGGGSSAPIPSGANKFWEVELDYAFDETRTVNSYLRLGTFEANPTLQTDANSDPIAASSASTTQNDNFHRGHDLAAMIVDFYDDTRDRGEPGDPFFTDPAERKAESALLHTKGGWRDHSDGNRISTTRGDKIEVVRGNYQMVVLGRQDQLADQSRYEAGGGHFARDNDNLTPGAIFKISWVQDKFNGTWKVIEETTKGDYRVRYHGDVQEEYFGNRIARYIGSETSGEKIVNWQSPPDDNVITANPEIVERTFAESIDIQQGSAKRHISAIHESVTSVNYSEIDFSRSETVSKDYSDGDITMATYAQGTITEERRGTYVGRFDGNSNEFWGMFVRRPKDSDTPEGFDHKPVASNFLEIFLGGSQSFKLGMFLEAIFPISMNAMLGVKLDALLGAYIEINAGYYKRYGWLKENYFGIKSDTSVASSEFSLVHSSNSLNSQNG